MRYSSTKERIAKVNHQKPFLLQNLALENHQVGV